MKPAPFAYLRATSTAEALDALRQAGGETRIIAGGQSLLPMLNMRLARPALLVDIMHIPGLDRTEDNGARLLIGAAVRQRALETRAGLAARQPLLAMALSSLGHLQTRTRGTLCGSVAHADPSAELPLALLALQGEVHLRSHRDARRVPATAFFTGMMTTARADEELIEAVSVPTIQPGTGYAFHEISRRHGDFAIAAFAAIANAQDVRLAIGGVAAAPIARHVPTGAGLADALDEFAWALEARDDLHASAPYRRELVRRIGARVVHQAMRDREARMTARKAA